MQEGLRSFATSFFSRIIIFSVFVFLCAAQPTAVFAQELPGQDQTPNNGAIGREQGIDSDSIFGTITPPEGTEQFSPKGEIGLLNFISMLVRIFTVVAGIIVFFNFILSGFTYVTSDGNAKAAETVRTRLTYSIIGLVLIVSAYVITALISLIIFGDASYILNPTITPPGVEVTTP